MCYISSFAAFFLPFPSLGKTSLQPHPFFIKNPPKIDPTYLTEVLSNLNVKNPAGSFSEAIAFPPGNPEGKNLWKALSCPHSAFYWGAISIHRVLSLKIC
jgi:hypothetical protein